MVLINSLFFLHSSTKLSASISQTMNWFYNFYLHPIYAYIDIFKIYISYLIVRLIILDKATVNIIIYEVLDCKLID